MNRRNFIAKSGVALAASVATIEPSKLFAARKNGKKTRIALVGVGVRGIGCWGKHLLEDYGDVVEFVGLADINPGRLDYAKKYIGTDCATFTNFDEMLETVPIDFLIVTTVDSTHDEFIIKGLEKNLTVFTEKPMTTDEVKCQKILDAERKSKGNVIVGLNYRYGYIFTQIKGLLEDNTVGEITSIDFDWYLNTYHGASYFRRWNGLREFGGTLLVHKSSHHFDLLNWYIGSEPVEVNAYGGLEVYGKNGPFRSDKCRTCPHTKECEFYWDITKDKQRMNVYVKNEHHDGYIRDKCLYSKDVDIYDKMAVQIKYANNVQVNYSLTTYSPYEGFRIAFNGKDGRLETSDGLPWKEKEMADQAALHAAEMAKGDRTESGLYNEFRISRNWTESKAVRMPKVRGGHWGGDPIMKDHIFKGITPENDYGHIADVRQGAMSILIGVAARKSIDEGRRVRIEELTDLKPA